jgi:hypothetical protein
MMKVIRSVSFDTSFLLNKDPDVEIVLKKLKQARIECYVTSTVLTELDALRMNYRINEETYQKAMKRWNVVNARVIDFKNRIVTSELNRKCQQAMGKHHDINPERIVNDCKILVVGLKNGVDLFLSEDLHFISKITDNVLKEIRSNACREYHLMCDKELFGVNTRMFLLAFNEGEFDLESYNKLRKKGN